MNLNPNDKIQAYINEVCLQVRFRDVHQDLRLELEAHIREAMDEHLALGSSEEEAINKVIAQMGDAETIGKQLNQVHKPKPEWSVLTFSLLFIATGLLAMYLIQKQELLTYFRLFDRSILYSIIGLISMVSLYFYDYRKLERYSKHIYLGTLFLLVCTILFGRQAFGSRSWLSLGPLNINFVAISPLLFSVAFAGTFNNWDWNNSLKLFQGLVLLGVPLLLFLAVPSISASIIYVVTCMVLLYVSGAKFNKIVILPTSLLAMLLATAMLAEPYRLERLSIFLNPEVDPQGRGYLYLQLRRILANSGFLGRGLTFEPRILPELHTDFIFTFISYTFGWIASGLLIAFAIMFLIRIARIAKQVKTTYAKLLISGFVAMLATQFIWNIFMNLGLAPISGVGLPFISYGGSQLIINAATVGIISSIYKRRNIAPSQVVSR